MAIAAITAMNLGGGRLADELALLAQRLRKSTVSVSGRGPGGGSGIVWRGSGLIITNAHVARGPHAKVELWDGRALAAEVTARDPQRDLAALHVDANDLPAADIGDSSELRVGELVLAVGNPFGVAGALTSGIVHAVGAAGRRSLQQWVQADVRLAPGNSGGPLADARGRVVGVNSMIAGGLALAVPSRAVERFILGQGQRPFLGVTSQSVEVDIDGTSAFGLLVLSVEADSPADRAGLLIGDIIVGAGGITFGEPTDLAIALYDAGAGRPMTLELVRGGRRTSRDVLLVADQRAGAEAA